MKYAYVTIITNESYIPCIIKNAQRMRYLNCKFPYHILLSESLRNNSKIYSLIQEPNIKINFFKDVNYSYKYHQTANDQISFNNHKFYSNMYNTLNKFEILTLEQYQLVMFLDADIILEKNLDCYFEQLYPKIINFYIEQVIHLDSLKSKEKNCFTSYWPNGQLFLCKPNLKLYNILKKIFLKHSYEDDEELLSKLFFQEIYNNSIITDNENYHHFDGRFKLYNSSFAFILYLFEQTTSYEFNILYNKYQHQIYDMTKIFSDLDTLNHKINDELNLGGV